MEVASKNFIANLKKQKRENKSLLFLDNIKIIKDALASGAIEVQVVLSSLENLPFDEHGAKVFKTDAKTIEILSDSKTPQGVICVCNFKDAQGLENAFEMSSNFLVLDGLQDPGNVGTLLRTALATDFITVFLLDGVRVTNPKLIRSSAGAVFSLRIFEMTRADFSKLSKAQNFCLICCDMNGENVFEFCPNAEISRDSGAAGVSRASGVAGVAETSRNSRNSGIAGADSADVCGATEAVGVVVGSEGQGVSDEIASLCKKTVKIPMANGLESLNAGVSGSIVMYQISQKLKSHKH